MSNSKRKFFDKNLLLVLPFLLILSNCALYVSQKINQEYDLSDNDAKFNTVSKLVMKGNVTIDTRESNGKLNVTYNYNMPDSLLIQFRDVLGRKQALMSFLDEEFELWLQRENKRFKRNEIPDNFSLFVFDELSLKEIRRLFLGLPIVSSENRNNIKIKLYESGLTQRIEILDKNEELSSIFIYSNYQLNDEIYLPTSIQIIDLNKGIELKIKLYHFSVEYFNLSNL